MLRFVGALTVGAACAAFGFTGADRLNRRRVFLRELQTSLTALKSEIELSGRALAEIFKSLNERYKLCGMYGICAEKISERGIYRAWGESVKAVSDAACLDERDIEAVVSLGAQLGMSDIEGQKNAIDRVMSMLSCCSDEAEERAARLSGVYRGCGVLAGAFFLLIFM